MNQALKPTFVAPQIADKHAESHGASDEERALFALSNTKGWLILKDYIDEITKGLNELNKNAIASGAPLEEIGRNAIVVNLVQDQLTRVINKVNDAVDACLNGE